MALARARFWWGEAPEWPDRWSEAPDDPCLVSPVGHCARRAVVYRGPGPRRVDRPCASILGVSAVRLWANPRLQEPRPPTNRLG